MCDGIELTVICVCVEWSNRSAAFAALNNVGNLIFVLLLFCSVKSTTHNVGSDYYRLQFLSLASFMV